MYLCAPLLNQCPALRRAATPRIASSSKQSSGTSTMRSRCAGPSRRPSRPTQKSIDPVKCIVRMTCTGGRRDWRAPRPPTGRSRGDDSLFGTLADSPGASARCPAQRLPRGCSRRRSAVAEVGRCRSQSPCEAHKDSAIPCSDAAQYSKGWSAAVICPGRAHISTSG